MVMQKQKEKKKSENTDTTVFVTFLSNVVGKYFICGVHLPSVLRCYWLGGRKGIRPVKN